MGTSMRSVLSVICATLMATAGPALASQKIGDGEVRIRTETDDMMLQSAKSACDARDFHGFFEAFTRSPFVREAYAAATVTRTINGVSTKVARDAYAGEGFPIALMDYYWVSAASARAVSADPKAAYEHLKMEFNQSQSDIWRIDWQRVRYDGKPNGGDDLGNEIGTYGEPGYLLFSPTATCWESPDRHHSRPSRHRVRARQRGDPANAVARGKVRQL